MSAQGWLAAVLVALAAWHMVRSGLAWLRRVRAGGSACGGCSGDGCAAACGTVRQVQSGGADAPAPRAVPAQPVAFHRHRAPTPD